MRDVDSLFFFNDPATTEIYTLSLHDALPISKRRGFAPAPAHRQDRPALPAPRRDRKSTRLNSSHVEISYAVFCLKKKKTWRLRARSASRRSYGTSTRTATRGPASG